MGEASHDRREYGAQMNANQELTLYRSNVELYDIAFEWEIDDEVSWLLKRLGGHCHSVLEPGCGSGRVLEAFAKKGVEVVGFDCSREGISLAQKRIASLSNASAIIGDMTNFDLGRIFDGAVCPINTLAILSPKQLIDHLDCMGRHLGHNASYLVQVAIRDREKADAENGIEWEAHRGDTHLRVRVWVEHSDYQNMRELHGFKIDVLSGGRKGEELLEKHWMTIWTAESFREIINTSQFWQRAQYDGDDPNRPSVPIGTTGNLMWHELVRR